MKKLAVLLTLLLLIIIGGGLIGGYNYFISPMDKNADTIEFKVEKGDTFTTIAGELKEKGLIRDVGFYKIYLKINEPDTIKEGIHEVSARMSLPELIKQLSSTNLKKEVISITFKEGRNMRYVVSLIHEKTGQSEEEIYNILDDENYLNELIENYWFLSDEIKNQEIYYSLEGYLYQDTYEIDKENADAKEIFSKMLDNMESKIDSLKVDIEESSYSFHELLTLASMVELEASTSEDRKGVAGVFYNRLDIKMSLGSDVTTYYAAKVDMGERDLYKSELNDYNAYNTRNANMAGKLPVGPISNPSITSLEAVVYPEENNYYYFVADKNKKVYFSKNSKEHNSTISRLKQEGLWYTYEN